MNAGPCDASGGPSAAWGLWSDPALPLRLAADEAARGGESGRRLQRWVEWVALADAEHADVDGVLVAAGDDDVAATLSARLPELPLLDERGADPARERPVFLEHAFSRNRWRARRRVLRPLAEFHDAHDLLLRVHGEEGAAELARLARAPSPALGVYGPAFRRHLARPTGKESVLRVLYVVLARLRPRLAPRDRRALRLAVDDYRRDTLPLPAPRALLRHHARVCGDEQLATQLFLDPYPAELDVPRVARTP